MTCTGHYIDIDDIVILLNEPNDEPTINEIDILERLVSALTDAGHIDALQVVLDVLPFPMNCMKFGVRVIDNRG